MGLFDGMSGVSSIYSTMNYGNSRPGYDQSGSLTNPYAWGQSFMNMNPQSAERLLPSLLNYQASQNQNAYQNRALDMGDALSRWQQTNRQQWQTGESSLDRQSAADLQASRLASEHERLQMQIDAAAQQGDLNRAQELEVQQRNLQARMQELGVSGQQALEQIQARSQADLFAQQDRQRAEGSLARERDSFAARTQAEQSALNRQAEMDMLRQRGNQEQALQREAMLAKQGQIAQQGQTDIYTKAAGLMSEAQQRRAAASFDEPMQNYQNVLNQGGMYTGAEQAAMKRNAYNMVDNQARQAGQQINNQLASRGLSANPYAAAMMGRAGGFAAGANRGAVGADIAQQQAQSRMGAMGAMTGIAGNLAQLRAAPTQESASRMAQRVANPYSRYR